LAPLNLYARDSTDAITPAYRGTVHFTSSDPIAILPPDHTFNTGDSGTFFPSVTFKTPGTQTVTAADTVDASITGVSRSVAVSSPVATSLAIGTVPPSGNTVGYPMALIVTARGSGGATDVNYRGTVDFTSATDPHAVLPAAYTFTAADNGSHVFCPVPPWSAPNSPCIPSTPTMPAPANISFTGGVVFSTTGDSQTVTATDRAQPPISGTSPPVVVTAGTPTKFRVSGFTEVPAGSLIAFTVSALNDQNTATRGYLGTVHLTSSDPAAVLPPDYTFTATDAGTYQNAVVTFKTVGQQTVTVADTANASVMGTSAPVTVRAGPVATTTTTSSTTTIPAATTTTTTTTTTTSTTTTTTAVGSTTTTTVHGSSTTTSTVASVVATASGPSTAHPGDQITLTGSGFPAGQQLRLTMLSTPTDLGNTMSDPTGAFRTTVTIPGDAALGAHKIVINTPDGVHQAFVAFTVTAASASPSRLVGPLSRTGASVLGPIALACLLMTSGVVALRIARERRQRLSIDE
ncbi:MAG: hypothetical protein M3N98_00015, partial [Actinomycetota bacterium]|nr:hypothetical protein [Actinomycetota bacterium]